GAPPLLDVPSPSVHFVCVESGGGLRRFLTIGPIRKFGQRTARARDVVCLRLQTSVSNRPQTPLACSNSGSPRCQPVPESSILQKVRLQLHRHAQSLRQPGQCQRREPIAAISRILLRYSEPGRVQITWLVLAAIRAASLLV